MTGTVSTLWRCGGLAGALLMCGLATAENPHEAQAETLMQRIEALRVASSTLRGVGEINLATQMSARATRLHHEVEALRASRQRPLVEQRSGAEARARQQARGHELEQLVRQLREQVAELRRDVGALREELDRQREQLAEQRLGRVDLAGAWEMTLPAGWTHRVQIVPQENGLLNVETRAANLAGAYQHRGSRFSIELPAEERMHGLAWKLKNHDTMVLVEGPDYLGATLVRLDGGRQPPRDDDSRQDAEQR